jgi:uncharacterized protein (TIGR02145 family)
MAFLTYQGKTVKFGNSFVSKAAAPPIQPIDVNVKYGYLYNWYAVTDSRNISNVGWHVPSQAEWQTLISYFGNLTTSGNALLESGSTYWNKPGTNSAKFNLRGTGYRTRYGFSNIKLETFIQTTTIANATNNIRWNQPGSDFFQYASFTSKGYYEGGSIRLLKDSTTLSHGQSGTYIGNDNRRVRTICVGNQEWLADNLVETKYRNGDDIITVTDQTSWYNLTSGAKCAYNNLESNVLI